MTENPVNAYSLRQFHLSIQDLPPIQVQRGGIKYPAVKQESEAVSEPTMIPYPGMGSGHAIGSDTSRERQEANDASGVTSRVQQAVLKLLGERKAEGMTSAELCDEFGIGEGMASSAFSHLHRAGRIVRVKHRRQRHEIYVLPEFVNGRELSPYRPRLKPARHPRELSRDRVLGIMMDAGVDESFYPEVRKVIDALP